MPNVVQATRKAKLRAALFGESEGAPSFGRYVVLGTLGWGGMGTVLEAFDRSLDRRVAVKVLHRDVAKRHTQRLVREAQALAKLSHPNVVQVYEVGELEGQTFVAMELVRGQTLRDWGRREPRPTWRQCVEVYVQAGAGLSAAHDVGLVHRDFKPGNAIIDDQGRVRVLDFGLARRTDELSSDGLTPEATAPGSVDGSITHDSELEVRLTNTGAVLGTLAYMPLEQMLGHEVDARGDQFSFCVSLYEAIYGQRPFEGDSQTELAAAITEQRLVPAPKGSTVPARLRHALTRGLSPKAEQRWPSMEALLAELSQVVSPRRRTRLALGLMGGLGLLGAGLAYQAGQSEGPSPPRPCTGARAQLEGVWDDTRRGEVEAAILGTGVAYGPDTWARVERHLDDYAQAWVDKHTEVCEATNVRQVQTEEEMSLRMGCLRKRKTDLAAAVNVLAHADAEVVREATKLIGGLPGLSPRCDDVDRLAEQRQRVPPPEEPDVAQEVERLRGLLADIAAEQRAGKITQAFERVEPVVGQAETLDYAPLHAESILRRGELHSDNGRYPQAERDLSRAHSLAAEHGHDEVMLTAAILLTHVVGYQLERHPEGLLWGRTAVSLARRSDDETRLPSALNQLGVVLHHQGNYEDAERHYREALERSERALGAEHPLVAVSRENLGLVLDRQGKVARARQQHERVLEIRRRTMGEEHPDIAVSLNNLGRVLMYEGRYEDAERSFRDALELRLRVLGPEHPAVASSRTTLGTALLNLGRFEDAKRQHQQAYEQLQRTLGDEHPELARSVGNLGIVADRQGRFDEAAEYHRKALQIWVTALGPEHPDVASSEYNLGNALKNQGLHAQARPHYERARQIWQQAFGADHPFLGYALVGLALADVGLGNPSLAREHAERALALREASEAPPELLAEARFTLAQALWFERAQRERAYALAVRARDAYAELGEAEKSFLEEVEQWLAERPEP